MSYMLENGCLYIPPDIEYKKKDEDRLPNGHFKKGHHLNEKYSSKRVVTSKMRKAMIENLKKATKKRMEFGREYKGRKCVGVKPDKSFCVFNSCRHAERVIGITNSIVSKRCNGFIENRFAEGFFWFWEDDNKWIDFINNSTEYEINEFIKKWNISKKKGISRKNNRKNDNM